MEQGKLLKPKPEMPKRRLCMMGNGKSVQPKKHVEHFCKAVVEDCLSGRFHGHEDFALGVAACFDAISRGTIDLDEYPRNVVDQMWIDVNNVFTLPNKVTDLMRIWGCK